MPYWYIAIIAKLAIKNYRIWDDAVLAKIANTGGLEDLKRLENCAQESQQVTLFQGCEQKTVQAEFSKTALFANET